MRVNEITETITGAAIDSANPRRQDHSPLGDQAFSIRVILLTVGDDASTWICKRHEIREGSPYSLCPFNRRNDIAATPTGLTQLFRRHEGNAEALGYR